MSTSPKWLPRHIEGVKPQKIENRVEIADPSVFTGAGLYARRISTGMNQDELAKVLGIAKRTLVRWEQRPDPIPEQAAQTLIGIMGVASYYFQCAAESEPGLVVPVYRSGWRDCSEFGFCLPEGWWMSVASVLPNVTIEWAPDQEKAAKK